MAILAVENLDINPFKGMNKTFRNGTISFVAGANNSYKTLLIKVLSGIVKTEEKIRVNRTFVEQITTKQYPYQIQVIFEDENFKTTTVKEVIKECVSFFLARIVTGILCDVGTFAVMVKVLKINDIISKVVTQVMVVILNYVFSKFIIFKNKK